MLLNDGRLDVPGQNFLCTAGCRKLGYSECSDVALLDTFPSTKQSRCYSLFTTEVG